ncbi:MAG: right-handed parallel beta-helix repeat-containing protein [bacterium]
MRVSVLVGCALLFAAPPAFSATIHVAPDSSGDFLNIQAAIDAASSGDVIELTDGVFKGPGNWELNLGTKELTLRSQHGAASTIIDCGYNDDVWAKHQGIAIRGGQTSATVIEGFTIQGVATTLDGGAVECVGSSPVIRNMVMRWSRGAMHGLGLFVWLGAPLVQDCSFEGEFGSESTIYSRQSSLQLERCTLEGCDSGGGVITLEGGALSLTDCTLDHCGSTSGKYPGVFVAAESGDLTLERCRLANGFALGVIAWPRATILVDGCTFEDLLSDGTTAILGSGTGIVRDSVFRRVKGGYYTSTIGWGAGSISLDHCVFVKNEVWGTWDGGVVQLYNATATISHCTFAKNTTRIGPTAISLSGHSRLSMDHTIIAFGTQADTHGAVRCWDAPAALDVTCTDIFGNYGGDWTECVAGMNGTSGNLSADPLFCTSASRECSLESNSPCAPANSGECGLIGAVDVGCGATALAERSWGSIKALYR